MFFGEYTGWQESYVSLYKVEKHISFLLRGPTGRTHKGLDTALGLIRQPRQLWMGKVGEGGRALLRRPCNLECGIRPSQRHHPLRSGKNPELVVHPNCVEDLTGYSCQRSAEYLHIMFLPKRPQHKHDYRINSLCFSSLWSLRWSNHQSSSPARPTGKTMCRLEKIVR